MYVVNHALVINVLLKILVKNTPDLKKD